MLSKTQPLLESENPDVAKVCQAIKTLASLDQTLTTRLVRHGTPLQAPDTSPLPWPPLPHEILGVDIFAAPFSSRPPNNNYLAWESSLKAATATALEPWFRLERGNSRFHNALSIASLCLRRPALLSVYRKMVDELMVGRWWWSRTITLDSEKRWNILERLCRWGEQGAGPWDGSEL
ncbi:hypothetical protein C8A00DRAFT_15041 [Chaetomidium leptoderma]|uniref:Uncharacterized protein n=1 Tax=Chaetomidium leptoderma TaxID=669021 RepID=A0AAN6VM29_9PEZI|nr:hypothetical protein C8A00DRAFT_15041 [Chaetomidium leptoderma]